CCLLGHRGRTLTVGGRAIGGAAQHLTGNALLHHGVLARTLDRPLVRRIFALPEAVAEEHLTSLEELGASAEPGRLADELGTALAASLGSSGGP
ncbi:MAG: hypothetical protein L3J91_02345, partial [Thermoplasmata archaeon]|nr:hypothetical protein [Thermoplasmata archaeon]